MSFIRQPLLKPEVEDKLKGELSELWLTGMKGRDIAQKLHFGVKGKPYEKLKPEYVYYYRQKFAKKSPELFPLRIDPPFAQKTSRYKHAPEELGVIEPEEFIETLNEKLPLIDSFYAKRARSYLLVQFYTPLRVSEIIERKITDFEITKTKITIHLLRKKKHHKPTDKDEPIDIPRVFPLVDEVYDWIILDGAVTKEGSTATYLLIDPNLDVIMQFQSYVSYSFLEMNPIGDPTIGEYYLAIFGNEYAEATIMVTTFENIPSIGDGKIDEQLKFTQSGQVVYYKVPQTQNYFSFIGINLIDDLGAKFQLIRPDRITEWTSGFSYGLAYFRPKIPDVNFYVLKIQGQMESEVLFHLRYNGQEDYQIETPDSSNYELRFSGDIIISRVTIRESEFLFQHYSYFGFSENENVFIGFYDENLNSLWEKTLGYYNLSDLFHFPDYYQELNPGNYLQVVIGVRSNEDFRGVPIVQLTTLQTGDETLKLTSPKQIQPTNNMDELFRQVDFYEIEVFPTHWFEIVSSLYIDTQETYYNPESPGFSAWIYGPPGSDSSMLLGRLDVGYPSGRILSHQIWEKPENGKWLIVVASIDYSSSQELDGSITFVSDVDFKDNGIVPEFQAGIIVPMILIAAILVVVMRRLIKPRNE
jgi:hypothetical protein